MATFLFLVTIGATTALLLASAAEEIARATRKVFVREHAEPGSASLSRAAVVPQASRLPRAAAPARPAAPAQNDWVPDQAA